MEKRRRAKASASDGSTTITSHNSSFNPFQQPSSENRKSAFWQPSRPGDRGATLGKLHEVDLGEENKIRNIHRTKEATRRLGGGQPMEDQLDNGTGKKKFRRRRRNSQDIQRDKLVEEVLKESKRTYTFHFNFNFLILIFLFSFLPVYFSSYVHIHPQQYTPYYNHGTNF